MWEVGVTVRVAAIICKWYHRLFGLIEIRVADWVHPEPLVHIGVTVITTGSTATG